MATYDAGAVPANCFDPKARTPWNNLIFPGNYVCHLNSYRNQGLNAYPGLEFFSLVGALVILPVVNTQSNVLDSSLQLPAAAYATQILSPDLGPAPKPLPNRNFVVPSGAYIYSTAVSTLNLNEATAAGTTTVTVTGVSGGAVLTADANGSFNECGARDLELDFSSITPTSANTSITVTTSAATKPVNVSTGGSGSAFADPESGQCAIIVEVDYFMISKGPDSDATHLPFPFQVEDET